MKEKIKGVRENYLIFSGQVDLCSPRFCWNQPKTDFAMGNFAVADGGCFLNIFLENWSLSMGWKNGKLIKQTGLQHAILPILPKRGLTPPMKPDLSTVNF